MPSVQCIPRIPLYARQVHDAPRYSLLQIDPQGTVFPSSQDQLTVDASVIEDNYGPRQPFQ